MRYSAGSGGRSGWKLEVLNHHLLPEEEVYEEIASVEEAVTAMREKKVCTDSMIFASVHISVRT